MDKDKVEVAGDPWENVDDRRENQRRQKHERRANDRFLRKFVMAVKVTAWSILGFAFLLGELGSEFASMIARIFRNTCNGG